MSVGKLLFYMGIAVLTAAVICTVIVIATGSAARRKMRERMNEKY